MQPSANVIFVLLWHCVRVSEGKGTSDTIVRESQIPVLISAFLCEPEDP